MQCYSKEHTEPVEAMGVFFSSADWKLRVACKEHGYTAYSMPVRNARIENNKIIVDLEEKQ